MERENNCMHQRRTFRFIQNKCTRDHRFFFFCFLIERRIEKVRILLYDSGRFCKYRIGANLVNNVRLCGSPNGNIHMGLGHEPHPSCPCRSRAHVALIYRQKGSHIIPHVRKNSQRVGSTTVPCKSNENI